MASDEVKTDLTKLAKKGLSKQALSDFIIQHLEDQFGKPKNAKEAQKLINIFDPPDKKDRVKLARKHGKGPKVAAAESDEKKDGIGGGGTAGTWPDQTVRPASLDEFKTAVQEAATAGKKIRIIGSNHSPEFTIFDQTSLGSGETVLFNLDNLKGITIGEPDEKQDVLVTVEAGIILGSRTPKLPDIEANGNLYGWDEGIVMQLDNAGLSLTDLGGIVHQAAGGFTAMGCAGGTIVHDYYETIQSLEMLTLDSSNKVVEKTYNRPADESNLNDEFWGVIVSMGLCGIITRITFKLNKVTNSSFNVVGAQTARAMYSWGMPKLLGGGDTSQSDRDNVGVVNFQAQSNDSPNSLYSKLVGMKDLQTEYMRFFWSPQSSLNWIQMWKGHTETAEDTKDPEYIAQGIYGADGSFIGKDYEQAGTGAQILAWAYYNLLDYFGFEPGSPEGFRIVKLTMEIFIFAFMMSSALPSGDDSGDSGDSEKKVEKKEKESVGKGDILKAVSGLGAVMYFGHKWYRTIPMDTTIYDEYMPFQFTEVWVDLEDTTKAINLCHAWFAQDQYFSNTGTFPWEFYCAKKDYAWMRPNYDLDCFRIDILWFDLIDPSADPYDFYLRFWSFCVENGLKCRPHWGKYCPHGNEAFPTLSNEVLSEWQCEQFATWLDYYKWILKDSTGSSLVDKFTNLVKANDPNGLFRLPYWDNMFNLSAQ